MGYGEGDSWGVVGVLALVAAIGVVCGVSSGAISLRVVLGCLGAVGIAIVLWFIFVGRTWL